MARFWFAKGLRGMIAKRIQLDLLRQGFFVGSADKFADGVFGGDTDAALRKLQASRGLSTTGAVDEFTWQQLTTDPIPSLFERCLSVTADFEGHGFGLLQGNFDGAGMTWGVIGFTLSNGEIQSLLHEVEISAPGTLDRVLGSWPTPGAQRWSFLVQIRSLGLTASAAAREKHRSHRTGNLLLLGLAKSQLLSAYSFNVPTMHTSFLLWFQRKKSNWSVSLASRSLLTVMFRMVSRELSHWQN